MAERARPAPACHAPARPEPARHARAPELVLVVVTLIWSCTFIATRTALRDGTPFAVMLLRFGIGLAALAVAFAPRLRGVTRAELRVGGAIGVCFFLVHVCLTLGLRHIASSRAAFIASLFVPLVPVLQLLFQRRRPSPAAALGILTSFAGLAVLTTRGGVGGAGLDLHLGVGDWLVLGNAVTMAAYVILVSGANARVAAAGGGPADPMRIAIVQVAVVAALALVAFLAAGEPVPRLTPTLGGATLFLGLLTTAFATAATNWAQRSVPPTRAAMIYAMQAVWAGLIGVLAGEPMTGRIVLGAALIVAGVMVSGSRGARGGEAAGGGARARRAA